MLAIRTVAAFSGEQKEFEKSPNCIHGSLTDDNRALLLLLQVQVSFEHSMETSTQERTARWNWLLLYILLCICCGRNSPVVSHMPHSRLWYGVLVWYPAILHRVGASFIMIDRITIARMLAVSWLQNAKGFFLTVCSFSGVFFSHALSICYCAGCS